MEVICPFGRAGLVPFARIMRVQRIHRSDRDSTRAHPAQSHAQFDARSSEPMQDVEPYRHEWRDDMRPVCAGAQRRIFQIKYPANANERQPREQQQQAHPKQQVSDAHRTAIWAVVSILNMEGAEDDYRQDEQKSQHQVREEHVHVEIVLECLARSLFFFKQKTAYEIQGDWSSDVCSSDLTCRAWSGPRCSPPAATWRSPRRGASSAASPSACSPTARSAAGAAPRSSSPAAAPRSA